ncbi:MAG: DUF5114 domain-containing protein [Prevotella sp.]|jgi:hypothetical protein|nr:DUF5114 domain-containing protein [Prevotella sp.]
MKTIGIKTFFRAVISIVLMTSCENDGDKIYLSSLEGDELIATESNIVLSKDNAAQTALSLTWTKSTLAVSNADMSAPDVIATYIQVSTHSDFSSNIQQSKETNLWKSYTVAELNALSKNLSIEPGIEIPVYFRLSAATGNNIAPVYSNIITVNVTSYLIDMSIGFILNSEKVDTGLTLASPELNGVYTGFMGAAGWYNYYLSEGDGTIWGNVGVDGSAFLLSSEADMWNLWFPEVSGCYYVEVNTIKKQWSALLVSQLSVSGDIGADMKFDRPNVRWTYVFNATAAQTLKIKLNGAGGLYDYTTGADTGTVPVSKTVAFAQSEDNLSLAGQAEEIALTVPDAGEYTLVVDLSNPKAWTCNVVKGSLEPSEINPYIYLPGIDDGISGNWTFDNYLTIYNEDDLAYAGVVNVNSKYGYSFNIEKDNWDDKYTLDEGNAEAGTLILQGNTNIPAPTAGLYLIETSIKKLTYTLTAIGSQVYVSGLNDTWGFDVPLTATSTVGVFTGPVTINAASSWGFSIHIKNGDWDHKYGGSDGKLYYLGGNITDDASLTPGTYQMTVNLINGTYNITQ